MANGALTKTAKVATAAPQLVVPGNSLRNYLLIENAGANDLEFGFDASLAVGAGIVLSPGGIGKQGGFLVWDGNFIPTNPIYVISAAGSTIVVLEG
jgi:hypothetical protein